MINLRRFLAVAVIVCMAGWLGGCQENTSVNDNAGLENSDVSSETTAPDETTVIETNSVVEEPVTLLDLPSQSEPVSFVDTDELQDGRFALAFYLTQFEDIEIPNFDQWTPVTMRETELGTQYLFHSGTEWELGLQEIDADISINYQAEIRGPEGFQYGAAILPTSQVLPAQ